MNRIKGKNQQKILSDDYFEFKAKIHERLLDIIDLSLIETMDKTTLVSQIKQITEKLHISKATFYKYLRHRGVKISPYSRNTGEKKS